MNYKILTLLFTCVLAGTFISASLLSNIEESIYLNYGGLNKSNSIYQQDLYFVQITGGDPSPSTFYGNDSNYATYFEIQSGTAAAWGSVIEKWPIHQLANVSTINISLSGYVNGGTVQVSCLNNTNGSLLLATGSVSSYNPIVVNINKLCINNNILYTLGLVNSDFSFMRYYEANLTVGQYYPYIIYNASYTNNSYEYQTEAFLINVTYNTNSYSSIAANLVYNGTRYTATNIGSNEYAKFTSTIPIPTVSSTQNRSFYFEIILTNSSGISYLNSTLYNQTINPITFTLCNATYPAKAVNFTIYDEANTANKVTSDFKATFSYGTNISSSRKTYSLNASGASSYAFCIVPNITYYVTSTIDLNASGYSLRSYNLLNEIYSNVTTDKPLYLVSTSIDSNIIIEVKNPGLQALKGYFIKIYRYYPETNTYTMVESQQTDTYGQVISRMIENDVRYRFEIYNASGTLKKNTTEGVKIACRSTICILPLVVEDTTDYFERFNNLTSYDYTFSFNNQTNIFSFSWSDNTGQSISHELKVTRTLLNGSSVICQNTSITSTGVLTCSVGSSRASYLAQAYRTASGTERLISTLTTKVGDIAATFKREGLFWSFILLMTLIAVGSFHPPTGIILFIVGFVALGTVGIIAFSWEIFVAILVIGGLFIWAFRS